MYGYCIFSVICVLYVFVQYFGAVGWVFWPVKIVARITYTVFVETLNPAQSMNKLVNFGRSTKKLQACMRGTYWPTLNEFSGRLTFCVYCVSWHNSIRQVALLRVEFQPLNCLCNWTCSCALSICHVLMVLYTDQ